MNRYPESCVFFGGIPSVIHFISQYVPLETYIRNAIMISVVKHHFSFLFLSPGCPRSSIALQAQNRGLKHHAFLSRFRVLQCYDPHTGSWASLFNDSAFRSYTVIAVHVDRIAVGNIHGTLRIISQSSGTCNDTHLCGFKIFLFKRKVLSVA